MTSADGDGLALGLAVGLGLALGIALALGLGLALGVGDAEGLVVGLGVADGLLVGSLVGVGDSSLVASVVSSDVGVALGSSSPVRAVSSTSESVDDDGLAVGEAVGVDESEGEAVGDAVGDGEAVADDDGAGVASGDGEVISSTDSDAVGDGDAVALGDGSSTVGEGEFAGSHLAGMSADICHSSAVDALSVWDGSGDSSAVGFGSAVSTWSFGAGCSRALAGSVLADNDVTTTAEDAVKDTSARSIARIHLPVSAVMSGVGKGKRRIRRYVGPSGSPSRKECSRKSAGSTEHVMFGIPNTSIEAS